MVAEKKTKLLIVCTSETWKYGTYLMQLISSKDDKNGQPIGPKDGSVEAVLWSEKGYTNNLPTLSSDAYVLFIGDSKLIKNESANMNISYNEFGMSFSSLGRRANIVIDKKILKKKEYEKFLSLCSKYEKNFEKVKLNFVNTANAAVKWIGVFAPVVYPAAIYGLISGSGARLKINDQKYTFLTLYTYLKILPKFLEG